jgi:CHAD domain-containing protein
MPRRSSRRALPGAAGVATDPSPGVRLRIPLELSLPRFLARSGYHVSTASVTRRGLRLFDTGDRRLAAAGAELSLSVRDGWTWRRDPLGHPKLTAREWTAPATTPSAQLREWTRAYRHGRPLGVRASVTVHRRRHQVGDDSSNALVTLLEERIDQELGARPTARVRRVTVVETEDVEAASIVLALIRGAAVEDAATLGLLRPASVRAPTLRPGGGGVEPRDLFSTSATNSLVQWLYFDCELAGGSPDALRKVRVALRRLRSDLQTFAPLFDRAWSDGLRGQLGDLATGMGLVRDAEVLTERLAGLVLRLPPADQPAAAPLLETAAMQLASARAQLLDSLEQPGYVAALDAAIDGVARPRWVDGDTVAGVAALARRPWRRLRAQVAALDGDADDVQLHRVRILAKRARYAADACVPAAGEPAARCAARLAELQTVLGDHHDAAVTREWLRRNAGGATEVSFVGGQLAALELIRVGEARDRWRDAWIAASRKQDWRWLRS